MSIKNTGDWSLEETEKIVAWLEEPTNLRRTQKGSGEKKSSWLKSIATTIPTRTESQVTYKYDNLKRAYRDSVQLANSSGWGLDEESLQSGERSIKGVLEKKCAFFFRLERVWGSRPNIRPPISFDSGSSRSSTTAAAATLIAALGTEECLTRDSMLVEQLDKANSEMSGNISKYRHSHHEQHDLRLEVESPEIEDDHVELLMTSEVNTPQCIQEAMQQIFQADNQYELSSSCPSSQHISETQTVLDPEPPTQSRQRPPLHIPVPTNTRTPILPENQERIAPSLPPSETSPHLLPPSFGIRRQAGAQPQPPVPISSRKMTSTKRQFPRAEDESDDELRPSQKKAPTTLGDAISVLSEKKYDFLSRQLEQQGMLREREIGLEKERLQLEAAKAKWEERQLELQALQFQAMMANMTSRKQDDKSGITVKERLESTSWSTAE